MAPRVTARVKPYQWERALKVVIIFAGEISFGCIPSLHSRNVVEGFLV